MLACLVVVLLVTLHLHPHSPLRQTSRPQVRSPPACMAIRARKRRSWQDNLRFGYPYILRLEQTNRATAKTVLNFAEARKNTTVVHAHYMRIPRPSKEK